MAPDTRRLAFDRRQANLNAQNLRRATLAANTAVITYGRDVTTQQSLGQGFSMASDIAIGERAIRNWSEGRGQFDDAFKPVETLQTPEYKESWEFAKNDPDLARVLGTAHNKADMDRMLRLYRENLDRVATAFANPGSGVSGIVMGALLSPTNLIPGSVMKLLPKIAAASKNARLILAARSAALEGGINTGILAAENTYDTSISASDYALVGGLGLGIGGAIGAFMKPGRFVQASEDVGEGFNRAAATATRDIAEAERAAPRAAGAEATPEAEVAAAELRDLQRDNVWSVNAPDPESNRTWVQRLTGSNFDVLRSVKQRLQEFNFKHGKTPAGRAVVDWFSYMLDWDQRTIGEMSGLPRAGSFAQARRALEGQYARTVSTVDTHTQNVLDLLRSGRRGLRDTILPDQGRIINKVQGDLSAEEIHYLIGKLAQKAQYGVDTAEEAKKLVKRYLKAFVNPDDEDKVAAVAREIDSGRNAAQKFLRDLADEANRSIYAGEPEPYFDLSAPYYPQRWIHDHLMAGAPQRAKAVAMVQQSLAHQVPDEFVQEVRDFMKSLGAEEELPGLVGKERWSDLDAETQEEVRDLLDTLIGKKVERARTFTEGHVGQAKGAARAEAVNAARARIDRLLPKAEERVSKARGELAEAKRHNEMRRVGDLKTTRDLTPILKRLAKSETERDKLVAELKTLDAIKRNDDALVGFLHEVSARRGLKAERDAAKRAGEKLAAATQTGEKNAKTAGRKLGLSANTIARIQDKIDPEGLAERMISNIHHNMRESDDETGFLYSVGQGGKVGESARAKPRSIDLSRAILDDNPDVDLFINWDLMGNLRQYMDSIGNRSAMFKQFGDVDPFKGERGFTELVQGIMREAPQEVEDLTTMAQHLVDNVYGRAGLKGTGRSRPLRYFTEVFKRLNVMNYLGSSGTMLPGDTALIHLAQRTPEMGRMGRQLVNLFSPRGVKAKSTALGKMSKNQLKALLFGIHGAQQLSYRANAISGITAGGLNIRLGKPGSRAWKLFNEAGHRLQQGSEMMFKLNGFNFWNHRQDEGLREAMLVDIWEYGKKSWDDIPEGWRDRMLAAGFGAKDLERMSKALDDAGSITYKEFGGLKLPDVDKLSDEDFAKLYRMIDTYASHGIIAPGLGDTPMFADSPLGQLAFQFQGFGYAAQQKLVRPMLDRGFGDANVQQALLAAFSMSVLSTMAWASVTGRLQEYVDGWNDPATAEQNLYRLYARSPFNVAANQIVMELIQHSVGLDGKRHGGYLSTLLGPTAGTIERDVQALQNIGTGLVGGDSDKVRAGMYMFLPFTTHIGARILQSALEEQ